jgi:hypothetical protein
MNWARMGLDWFGSKIDKRRHLEPLLKQIKQAVDAGNVALVVLQYIKWKSNDVLPIVSGKDKYETFEIIDYFNIIKTKNPEKVKQFNKEFNEKGVQAARTLVSA